jgi:hypothetical protein
VTARFALEPPQPDVQTDEATVRTSVCAETPQIFVAERGMLNVPTVVGVPLIVFVEVANESPAGRVDGLTENVTAGVDEAVSVYEKGVPTVADAVSELVIPGT